MCWIRRHSAITDDPLLHLLFLLRPGKGAGYCDQPVCPCVCLSVCLSVREHISGTDGPIRMKFCVRIPCDRGSVLLRGHCATLCTSAFMDDVIFGRNGRDAGKGWQHSALVINYVRDREGVWCLWMLVFLSSYSTFSPNLSCPPWRQARSNWNFNTMCRVMSVRGRDYLSVWVIWPTLTL